MPIALRAILTPRRWGLAAGLLVLLLLLFSVSLIRWGLGQLEASNRAALGEYLRVVLYASQEGLRLWAKGMKAQAQTLANDDSVRRAVRSQLLAYHDHQALEGASLETLRRQIDPLLQYHGKLGVVGFAVLAPDGTELAAEKDAELGTRLVQGRDPATVKSALAGDAAMGLPSPTPNGPRTYVGAAVRDWQGQIIAALLLVLDPTYDFTRFAHIGRLGKSGETYAFDRSGRLLTDSRFDDQLHKIGLIKPQQQAILALTIRDPGVNLLENKQPKLPRSQQPLTLMAQSAVTGQDGMDLDGYRDYRGVLVVGAWLWDKELNMGLTTEIDADEALTPMRVANRLAWMMLGSLLISCSILMTIIWSRTRSAATCSVRAREQLLNLVSHELRNPLNTINLHVSWLRARALSAMDNSSLKKIETVEFAVKTMGRLISDLLSAAQLEAGTFVLDRRVCAPVELAQKAIELHQESARVKSMNIKANLSENIPNIVVDPYRIIQVISNLIGNAIKFAPGGSEITVRVAMQSEKDLRVSVHDQGPGILAKEIPLVFERYWKSRYSLARSAGAGLGLFITRGLVAAHGGHIWVESKIGQGSTFAFTIPVASEPAPV